MTSLTPRPMSTPDLAGILGKPRRRAPQPPREEPEDVATSAVDLADDEAGAGGAMSPEVASISRARRSRPPVDDGDGVGDAGTSSPKKVAAGRSDEDEEKARGYLRTISVYLPRSLYRRLMVEAEERQMSRTALLLVSVNEVHDRLPELLMAAPTPRGALFDVPQARAPREEPNTQTSMRVTDQQLSILEALAKEYGTTRSRVLAAAFLAYVS